MRHSFSHIKLNKLYFIAIPLLLLTGVLLTLSFGSLRYTKYIEPKMVEIDPVVAYQSMVNNPGTYLFFDVRTSGEYSNLHASSSINVPIQQLYDKWRTLPRSNETPIYLICTSGKLAAVAYGYLQLHGFTNIVHITGGIQNWINEGQPAVSRPIFVDKNFSLDKPIETAASTSVR